MKHLRAQIPAILFFAAVSALGACGGAPGDGDDAQPGGAADLPSSSADPASTSQGEESTPPGSTGADTTSLNDALERGMDVGDISGFVRLFLTDAPGDYDAVWVSVPRVEVGFAGACPGLGADESGDPDPGDLDPGEPDPAEADAGNVDPGNVDPGDPDAGEVEGGAANAVGSDSTWSTLSDAPVVVDLLTLQDDVTEVLDDSVLEPGCYTQLRLVVDDAWVELDGDDVTLTVPSESIKIDFRFEVEAGKTYALVLDFDADESIHDAQGKGLILKPVVRVKYLAQVHGDGTMTPVQSSSADGSAGGTSEGQQDGGAGQANGSEGGADAGAGGQVSNAGVGQSAQGPDAGAGQGGDQGGGSGKP